MISTIVIATNNQGKQHESEVVLSGLPLKLLTLKDFPQVQKIPEPPEDGATYEENAIIKAKFYGHLLNEVVMADDTGLEVEVLDYRPGIHSHRYAETSEKRNLKLLEELRPFPNPEQRKAAFKTAIALYDPRTDTIKTFTGFMPGKIALEPSGGYGFGYDPLFINSLSKTNAELTTEEKNVLSARGQALRQLKHYLLNINK